MIIQNQKQKQKTDGNIKTDALKEDLAALLVKISDWMIERNVGTGTLDMPVEDGNLPGNGIFTNGNLIRTLICTYEITGHAEFLAEAIKWCDYLVYKAAKRIKTSKGNEAVWWWDFATHDIYLADTGTAMHALFKIYPYIDSKRKKDYLEVLEKFYLFVKEGCVDDPRGRCGQGSSGWIITSGPDAGALGLGYLSEPVHPSEPGFGVGDGIGWLETRPYTISTATVGVQMCSILYKLTQKPEYKEVAVNAFNWLLKQFNERGNIPYRIAGRTLDSFVFQGIHYTLEGFLSAWLYLGDETVENKLKEKASKIRDFVLSVQNQEGYWGKVREYDGQRNAFLAHFLHWYYKNVEQDMNAENGAVKFAQYVLNPHNTYEYGIFNLTRVVGFVGLTFASMLYSELDICWPVKGKPLPKFDISGLRERAEKWLFENNKCCNKQK
jgi:hypothetical protein